MCLSYLWAYLKYLHTYVHIHIHLRNALTYICKIYLYIDLAVYMHTIVAVNKYNKSGLGIIW